MVARAHLAALAAAGATLAGCQTNLPPLETSPAGLTNPAAPVKVSDLECHIKRELYDIVNVTFDSAGTPQTTNLRLRERLVRDPNLRQLIPRLHDDNFVATVTLTLDVLDAEGFTPSFSFIAPFNLTPSGQNLTTVAGFGVSGTQERNITENYAVDLASLQKSTNPPPTARRRRGCMAILA